jgi:hypothetical protein
MKRPRRSVPAVTTPARGRQREPRLPHERDESSDNPATPINPDALALGRQAARDLERGLVDTDRGPVVERLSQQHFSPAQRRVRQRR